MGVANYAGHNYIGHNYIGHNHIGHNYVGHNYAGHNYIVGVATEWQPSTMRQTKAAAECYLKVREDGIALCLGLDVAEHECKQVVALADRVEPALEVPACPWGWLTGGATLGVGR